MCVDCVLRTATLRKLLVAELKISVEGGTLRVEIGTRNFWSGEPFNSIREH